MLCENFLHELISYTNAMNEEEIILYIKLGIHPQNDFRSPCFDITIHSGNFIVIRYILGAKNVSLFKIQIEDSSCALSRVQK